jgi:hypothetical protein
MSDVDDPDVSAFDKVVNAIGVSRYEPAPQLGGPCVSDTQMRPCGDKCRGVKDRPSNPVGRFRVLSSDIFDDFAEIFPCSRREPERHGPRGLNSAAISSADANAPRFA